MESDVTPAIKKTYKKYAETISSDCSHTHKLKVWSKFIRVRDGNRCIICGSNHNISAHHICRKIFLPLASLQTGNGATLCSSCHSEVHAGFNGRPDMNLPMDAQGGEKIEMLDELYQSLLADAYERKLLHDDYYYLSDDTLRIFSNFQGCDPEINRNISRLEQAVMIWNQSPRTMHDALLRANGFYDDFPDVLQGEVLVAYD